MRKGFLAAGVLALASFGLLAGCSSYVQPSVGEYGITTGHGALSNQQVISVTEPGGKTTLGSGTTTWYVYANTRNYVTGPNGDRAVSAEEITAPSGSEPGMPDYIRSYLAFELNPKVGYSTTYAQQFLKFCLKYGCASQTSQNDSGNSDQAHSSLPGWNNMLAEVMPQAIDLATRDVITKFGPNLWNDQAEWPALADDIAAQIPHYLNQFTGSSIDGVAPFFCGVGSTNSKCAPFTMQVTLVQPVNPGVIQAYNQNLDAQYQQQAAAERLSVAQKLYGRDANWELAMSDLINQCDGHCTFYLGNAPVNASNSGG